MREEEVSAGENGCGDKVRNLASSTQGATFQNN